LRQEENIMGKAFLLVGIAALLAVCLAPTARADEFTREELKKWDDAFQYMVKEGEKVFHSGSLGGNTVSCDMCHPHASNTHPETYPKFQKQIGKVVGLRDMINWCIENPLQGKKLAADDQKMFALEAYITWERRGVKLEPGKH
jgi:thiosulfate dehydrogenase